jgi:hypothetical protein
MRIETKYSVGDKVLILDLDRAKAVVRGICITEDGVTFHVYWFHNGERKDAWVFESEISARE